MAFICYETQDCVDFAISVLLDETSTLQESAMTVILVQIKQCLTGCSPTAYAFSQEQVDLFPKAGNDESLDHPYIILILELGAKPRGSPPMPMSIAVSSQPEVQHYLHNTHPCFSVTAYGCFNTLYRVTNKEENTTYIHLLATHGLLEEHPHKDSDTLL
ncbi:hypothetical protein J3R82DRAFT_3622 [Butyriboletus roseoflavus]|nr:hypothetical protein J3R82DRAFT_3622 [Butyriboletus roseoflavus]